MARGSVRSRLAVLGTVVGTGLLVVALGCVLARALPGLPGVASDTWAMVTAFVDAGAVAAVAGLVLLLGSLLLRASPARWLLLVLALLLSGLHLGWLAPALVPDRDPVAGPERVRVLAQNMLFGRADPDSLVRASADADVVVLVEITRPLAASLAGTAFDERFPYADGAPLPASGPSGTRVYSRWPLTGGERLDPAGGGQNWRVVVAVPGLGPLTVAAVHPRRPHRGAEDWLPAQQQVLAHVPTTRTIVAGDLNAVDSHPTVRRYADLGFRDADDVAGAGWQPTFPVLGPVPPLIAIDHVLVSRELTATAFRTVRVEGSDHLGVLADVALRAV